MINWCSILCVTIVVMVKLHCKSFPYKSSTLLLDNHNMDLMLITSGADEPSRLFEEQHAEYSPNNDHTIISYQVNGTKERNIEILDGLTTTIDSVGNHTNNTLTSSHESLIDNQKSDNQTKSDLGEFSNPAKSCKELLGKNATTVSKANYWIETIDGEILQVICPQITQNLNESNTNYKVDKNDNNSTSNTTTKSDKDINIMDINSKTNTSTSQNISDSLSNTNINMLGGNNTQNSSMPIIDIAANNSTISSNITETSIANNDEIKNLSKENGTLSILPPQTPQYPNSSLLSESPKPTLYDSGSPSQSTNSSLSLEEPVPNPQSTDSPKPLPDSESPPQTPIPPQESSKLNSSAAESIITPSTDTLKNESDTHTNESSKNQSSIETTPQPFEGSTTPDEYKLPDGNKIEVNKSPEIDSGQKNYSIFDLDPYDKNNAETLEDYEKDLGASKNNETMKQIFQTKLFGRNIIQTNNIHKEDHDVYETSALIKMTPSKHSHISGKLKPQKNKQKIAIDRKVPLYKAAAPIVSKYKKKVENQTPPKIINKTLKAKRKGKPVIVN